MMVALWMLKEGERRGEGNDFHEGMFAVIVRI